jgi:Uri superfamily endonuclease
VEETALTTAPGAYALFIALDATLALPVATLGPAQLAPGHYAYCGSAYGPGGLRARLRHHLRRTKTVHWHIDRLTNCGRIFALGLALGGRECALVEALRRQPGVEVPLAGFGSSDCRRCPAHLLGIARETDPKTLAGAVDLAWIEVSDAGEADSECVAGNES